MNKRLLKRIITAAALVTVISVCMTMTLHRAAGCFELFDAAAVAAGYLSFDNGELNRPPTEAPTAASRRMTAAGESASEPTERPTQLSYSGDAHPIVEISGSSGDISYGNVIICNGTPYEPDIAALLDAELPFTPEDNHTVQVLIYHTHTCESYIDTDDGVYYDDFYPRSTDGAQGVIAVGDRIAAELKSRGIGVIHDTTLHDYPSYDGSYGRSWDTISAYREKYPGIKVTLDIHRDSMTTDSGTKYKPVCTHDGVKLAQIMIMTGYDEGDRFPFWDENLIFAVQLQDRCEALCPGMTRPLEFGEFVYNMNFNNGSLLIEVGTDANTVEEACRSGDYLGEALADLLTDSR